MRSSTCCGFRPGTLESQHCSTLADVTELPTSACIPQRQRTASTTPCVLETLSALHDGTCVKADAARGDAASRARPV